MPAEAPAAPPLPRPARLDDQAARARREARGSRTRTADQFGRNGASQRRVFELADAARRTFTWRPMPGEKSQPRLTPRKVYALTDIKRVRTPLGRTRGPSPTAAPRPRKGACARAAGDVRSAWTWPTGGRSTSRARPAPRRAFAVGPRCGCSWPTPHPRFRGTRTTASVLQAASLQFWSVETHLDVALTQSVSCARRKHHTSSATARRRMRAATIGTAGNTLRAMRCATLYALVAYATAQSTAQDTYASLRRAARQSYGFGDARYASHPRRAVLAARTLRGAAAAAAGGNGNQNVCESRSRAGVAARPVAERWRGRPTASRPRRASTPSPRRRRAAGRARAAAKDAARAELLAARVVLEKSRAHRAERGPGRGREPRHRGDDVALLPEFGHRRRAEVRGTALAAVAAPAVAFSRQGALILFEHRTRRLCHDRCCSFRFRRSLGLQSIRHAGLHRLDGRGPSRPGGGERTAGHLRADCPERSLLGVPDLFGACDRLENGLDRRAGARRRSRRVQAGGADRASRRRNRRARDRRALRVPRVPRFRSCSGESQGGEAGGGDDRTALYAWTHRVFSLARKIDPVGLARADGGFVKAFVERFERWQASRKGRAGVRRPGGGRATRSRSSATARGRTSWMVPRLLHSERRRRATRPRRRPRWGDAGGACADGLRGRRRGRRREWSTRTCCRATLRRVRLPSLDCPATLRRYASRRAGRARPTSRRTAGASTGPGKEDVVRSSPGSETRVSEAESAPVRSNRAFSRFVFTAALSMFAFGLATGSVASALVFLEDASSAAALTTSAKARLVAAKPTDADPPLGRSRRRREHPSI